MFGARRPAPYRFAPADCGLKPPPPTGDELRPVAGLYMALSLAYETVFDAVSLVARNAVIVKRFTGAVPIDPSVSKTTLK